MLKKIRKRLDYFIRGFNSDVIEINDILMEKYGWMESYDKKIPLNNEGKVLPWYTYPAIEFLEQFDFTKKAVLEYGSGNSSVYWGNIANKVISIEHNKVWYEKNKKRIKTHNEIFLCEKQKEYVKKIKEVDKLFDIIVIDGEWRKECAETSLDNLSESGFVILDNSDWFPETAAFIRGKGLLQVDFHGFGPINSYTWTTSIFIRNECNLFVTKSRQPENPIGGIKQIADGE